MIKIQFLNDTFSICYLFNVVRKCFYVSDNNFSKRKQPMSGIYRTIIRNAINVISNYEQCLIRSCANCRIVKTTFLVYLYSSTTLISLQISTPAKKIKFTAACIFPHQEFEPELPLFEYLSRSSLFYIIVFIIIITLLQVNLEISFEIHSNKIFLSFATLLN